jgi:4-hydroxy-tetrahydrodipicolinate reductase
MADMRLVVTGAGGRMGRMLIKTIHDTPGAILSGALEREGSIALGEDAGLLAGCGKSGVAITVDPLAAVLTADGILDFSTPAASVEFAALAAQARIAHIIGTTGLSGED